MRKFYWLFVECTGVGLSVVLAGITFFFSIELVKASAAESLGSSKLKNCIAMASGSLPQKASDSFLIRKGEEPGAGFNSGDQSVRADANVEKIEPVVISEPKDAIANTMTAVATAIAAVTLILSLGTSWFGQRLKEVSQLQLDIDQKLKDVENQRKKYEEEFNKFIIFFERQACAKSLMLDAFLALREWIDVESKAVERYSLYIKLSSCIEILSSGDAALRFEAFGSLITHLPDRPTSTLLSVEKYTEYCHQLHGGTPQSIGTWTQIFSAVERQNFADRRTLNETIY